MGNNNQIYIYRLKKVNEAIKEFGLKLNDITKMELDRYAL